MAILPNKKLSLGLSLQPLERIEAVDEGQDREDYEPAQPRGQLPCDLEVVEEEHDDDVTDLREPSSCSKLFNLVRMESSQVADDR